MRKCAWKCLGNLKLGTDIKILCKGSSQVQANSKSKDFFL